MALLELLHLYTPSRERRSSANIRTLTIARFYSSETFNQKSFSQAGPSAWNDFSYNLRHSESQTLFVALKHEP